MLSINLSTLAIIFMIVLMIYKLFMSRISTNRISLSNIPTSHWSSSFSSAWILWIRYKDREHQTLHEAHLKLGPIIRVAPNEISISDINIIQTVYGGGYSKNEWYTSFGNYGVPCMFSTLPPRSHSVKRRMISHVFSKSAIFSSLAVEKQSQIILFDRLLPLFNEVALSKDKSTNNIEIHEIWNAAAMDFVTAYLFGIKNATNFLNCVEFRQHWFRLYSIRKTNDFFSQELPRLTNMLKQLHINTSPARVKESIKEIEEWALDHCDATHDHLKRIAGTKLLKSADRPVVFEALLQGIEKENVGNKMNTSQSKNILHNPRLIIASEMLDHLLTGYETSGIVLTNISWHLSWRPSLQKALRAELKTLSPNVRLSPAIRNGQLIPSPKALDALPLLHAVLMETLRYHSAFPGGQPRMTPPQSCTLGPYHIPGNVRVGAQSYILHHNASVYPEPNVWNHERWLDTKNSYTEEQKRERDRWFWAFGGGNRMCLGKNFAIHEIKLIVAAVYTSFHTYLVDNMAKGQVDGSNYKFSGKQLILRIEKAQDG